jgi:phosphate transport system substrate-binding protein
MRRRVLIATAGLLLPAGRLAAQAFTGGSALTQGFSGAGSTFAQPILERWGHLFAAVEGDGGAVISADSAMDYQPVGSLGGVVRVMQGQVDFGATDVPLPPETVEEHSLAQFPFVSGGVAVAANPAGLGSATLRLSGALVADIFLGAITRWADPAIAALNPGLRLPDRPIQVVRRTDGSGTTWHFAAYLAASNEAWRSRVGVDQVLNWPIGTGMRGSRALVEAVRATPGAIGYVEANQAARAGLALVAVDNRAGNFVLPTPTTIAEGLAGARWDAARHFHLGLAEPNGTDAYPIAATAFALVPRRASARQNRLTLAFFRTAMTEHMAAAEALGFVPLPPETVAAVQAYWRQSFPGRA